MSWGDAVGDAADSFLGGAVDLGERVLNLRDRFRPANVPTTPTPVTQVAPSQPPATPQPVAPQASAARAEAPGGGSVLDWVSENSKMILVGSVALLALALVLRSVTK